MTPDVIKQWRFESGISLIVASAYMNIKPGTLDLFERGLLDKLPKKTAMPYKGFRNVKN